MKKILSDFLESGRIVQGPMASFRSWGPNGAFIIHGPCSESLKIIATDAKFAESEGWEHVSISKKRRTPNWEEMNFVKDLFFEEEEAVIQFHPPKSQYVNCHPFCLHLWRPIDGHIRLPPSILVGPK